MFLHYTYYSFGMLINRVCGVERQKKKKIGVDLLTDHVRPLQLESSPRQRKMRPRLAVSIYRSARIAMLLLFLYEILVIWRLASVSRVINCRTSKSGWILISGLTFVRE